MSDSLALAHEAVTFARSSFGKHYLYRLAMIRDDYRKKAETIDVTESESRAYSLKASAYDDEIRYFKTAESITTNPTLVKKLTDMLKRKEGTT